MFGKRLVLFELFGFKVQADMSWLFLALLVTWSLAQGLFPAFYPGLPPATYWKMGVIGMIGLFFSLVLHELSHALVARHYGLSIKGITLFIFGGVAEMEEEPDSAKTEFLMAIAGPIASLALAAGFHGLTLAGAAQGVPDSVLAVAGYLAFINVVLAVFNLVPAFPLDGGRALRAALWYWKGDLRWATRLASRCGQVFGIVLISLGVLSVLTGDFIGGMWLSLIGLFLRGAASASYTQLITRQAFEGEPVSRFMTLDPVTVSLELSVESLIEDYIYGYHYDLFPVVDGPRLVGLVSTRQVREVPRAEWARARVADILVPCGPDNTIGPRADAVKALSVMRRGGNSRLMVADGDRLLGVIALKDLLEFLGLKMDLERLE
ncbi:MAG: site-2 protease family protein [Rhodospirillales bacterium]|nr:site-2 protease family protein [Rhodospirillales bacterium]MDH3919667.1 site-2 protease family protein [Rhodospirillales bacterium]MDH3967073.1 site-2 protease family protein [Rhodospirillales bacterium]